MDPCKNHPDRPARRRCYRCREPVCPGCQHHLDRHIFCGHRCHQAWRRAQWRQVPGRAWRRYQHWLNPVLWWRYPAFRRREWAQRATVALWLVLLVNLAMAVVLYRVAGPGAPTTVSAVARSSGAAATAVGLRAFPPPARGIDPTFGVSAAPHEPRWLAGPTVVDGRVEARVHGGGRGAVVLKNGQPALQVPPGETRPLTAATDLGPAVWHLAGPGAVRRSERWTWPASAPTAIEQVDGAPAIALTFDGGASANVLDPVLAALRSRGVRATFFLTGQFLRDHPEAARRVVLAGHEVGNHTWSHSHLTDFDNSFRHETLPGVTRQWLQWELLKTENLFHRITGAVMRPLWRAPYGEFNAELDGWARAVGYRHVGWTRHGGRHRSLDTLDWVSDPADPLYVSGRAMADRVVRLAAEPRFRGGIVLMHVGVQRRRDRIQDELGRMIDGIRRHGLALATVSELLEGAG